MGPDRASERAWRGARVTIGRWSRRSVGVSGPGRRGGTCRVISLPGRPSGGVSTMGQGRHRRRWSCRVRRTRSRIWSGWSRSTPPWRGHTSTPPEHAPAPQGQGRMTGFRGLNPTTTPWVAPEVGGAPRPTSVSTGADARSRCGSPRTGRRQPPAVAADRRHRGPRSRKRWSPAVSAGLRDRGQGLLPSLDPTSVTPQGNPGRDPREERPDRTPRQQGQPRRQAAPLRRRRAYRDRNVVERAFNRLKGWRGVATRYDKLARNYRAGVIVACIVLFFWHQRRLIHQTRPSTALSAARRSGDR